MRVSREVRAVADALEERAAAAEATARAADASLPCLDVIPAAPLAVWSRSQWREAGVASVLREVAGALRAAELPMLRARTWLVARQVECDCAAEDAMARVARAADVSAREAAVARSAFLLGRSKGAKIAAELCRSE